MYVYIYIIYILYKDGKPKKTTILLSNSSGTDLAPGRGRQCSIPTEWPHPLLGVQHGTVGLRRQNLLQPRPQRQLWHSLRYNDGIIIV